MLAIKPAAVLLLLGVGGLLGLNERAAPSADTAPAAARATSEMPETAVLREAIDAAISGRVRVDLDDAKAQLALGPLALVHSSLRSLEARGQGVVQMPGSRPIPVEVVGVYDLVDKRLESVDYTAHPVEEDLSPVDRAVRAAIGQRIGERIAAEFPSQRTRFQLVEVSRVAYGEHRTRLHGTGLTDFGEEGTAWTPFEATLDKHTGELLELRYELLEEPPSGQVVADL